MEEVKKYTDEELKKIQDGIAKAFIGKEGEGKRWALMLFFTEMELGISNKPNRWVNVRNIYYNTGIEALNAYSNTKCPASQLVDGKTDEELQQNMLDMLEHYRDEKWLEENLYPYM
jgi:hypothetical protein